MTHIVQGLFHPDYQDRTRETREQFRNGLKTEVEQRKCRQDAITDAIKKSLPNYQPPTIYNEHLL